MLFKFQPHDLSRQLSLNGTLYKGKWQQKEGIVAVDCVEEIEKRHGNRYRFPFLSSHRYCHCIIFFSFFSISLEYIQQHVGYLFTHWDVGFVWIWQVGYQFLFFVITALLKFDKVTDFAGTFLPFLFLYASDFPNSWDVCFPRVS